MRSGSIRAFGVSSRLFRLTGLAAMAQLSLFVMVLAVALAPSLRHVLPLELPGVEVRPAQTSPPPDQLLLHVREGEMLLNGETLSESRLIAVLAEKLKEGKTSHVFLDADPGMSWDKVVYFMDVLHRAGVESIGLTPDLSLWVAEHHPVTLPDSGSKMDGSPSSNDNNASVEDKE